MPPERLLGQPRPVGFRQRVDLFEPVTRLGVAGNVADVGVVGDPDDPLAPEGVEEPPDVVVHVGVGDAESDM